MTLFSCSFNFKSTVRIWDIYFVEGKKIIHRVALAMFKINEKELLAADLEGVFKIFRNCSKDIDPDKLIKTGLTFTFGRKYLDQLEEEYKSKPDSRIAELCEMS